MTDHQIQIEYTEDEDNNIKIIVPRDVEEACENTVLENQTAKIKFPFELNTEILQKISPISKSRKKKVEKKSEKKSEKGKKEYVKKEPEMVEIEYVEEESREKSGEESREENRKNIRIIVPPEIKYLCQNNKVNDKYEIIEFNFEIKSSNDSMQNEYFTDYENTFTNNSNIFAFTKLVDEADIDYFTQQENSEKIGKIIVPDEIKNQCESAKKYQIKDPQDVNLSFEPQLDKGKKISVKFQNMYKGLNLMSRKLIPSSFRYSQRSVS